MSDRLLKLRELRAILRRFDCWEDSSRGKGGHTMFFRRIEGSVFSCPLPGRQDVLRCYLTQVRRKFHLTSEDGVTDEMFYGD